MGKSLELYLLLTMEDQVISHLYPLTSYQNLDLAFRIRRDLRDHLVQPSVFGQVRCDYHYLKGEASDAQTGGSLSCPR